MKQIKISNSQITELGKKLGLDTEQICSILNNTQQTTEDLLLSQGPYAYPGSYYGTISINDFNNRKK